MIAFMNRSTVLTDAQVSQFAWALQWQANHDFAPRWGLSQISLVPFGTNSSPPPGSWQLVVLDDADVAQALGYHDLTPDGLPMGKVFAKTTIDSGADWHVTASHELLEMLADPWINTAVQVDASTFYGLEVCDAVEDDSLGYQIGGFLVSDFILPAWFNGDGKVFDKQHHCQAPGQILPGGYSGVLKLTGGEGWTQIYGQHDPKAQRGSRAAVGSRRERRRIPRTQWIRSTAR